MLAKRFIPTKYTLRTLKSRGCRRCGHGHTHIVISPYRQDSGFRYSDKAQALTMVHALNVAMAVGHRQAMIEVEAKRDQEVLRLARSKKYMGALKKIADAKGAAIAKTKRK